jgi:hypothetical protein
VSVTELSRIIPPPRKPLGVGTLKQWKNIEKEIGIDFPEDYREFIFLYGTGNFANFFGIMNPFRDNWRDEIRWRCDNLRSHRTYDAKEVPFPVYPEAEGLFPWGADVNGNEYYWLTKGTPDRWTTFQNDESAAPWIEFKDSMTAFLVKALKNQYRKKWSRAQPFSKEDYIFQPVD